MSMTCPISDMLTRIRNAQSALHKVVTMYSSKIKVAIAEVLKKEGYIADYQVQDNDGKAVLSIELKYYDNAKVISRLERVSKPGKRIYSSCKNLPRVMDGYGIAIISTPQGVMSDREARKLNLGGEIICEVA